MNNDLFLLFPFFKTGKNRVGTTMQLFTKRKISQCGSGIKDLVSTIVLFSRRTPNFHWQVLTNDSSAKIAEQET